MYYIYMYLDLDNIPFYVGKGKNGRYKVYMHLRKSDTNSFLKNKIRKVGEVNVKIQFLHRNLTEKEAFHWERYWIKYYGRRDLGTGTLCNLTDGGEIGPTGHKHTEEAKRKMSESSKGQVAWNRGIPHTVEMKQKISETLKGNPKLAYWKGKTLLKETKRKMRIAQRRRRIREHAASSLGVNCTVN